MTNSLVNLHPKEQCSEQIKDFVLELKKSGFLGDISSDYGDRLSLASDNSVYQLLPQLICFPKSTQDCQLLMTCIAKESFKTLSLTARAGGTGCNGQSLNTGVIMDMSRHMTQILELNEEQGWVRVQPGVVLDALMDFLKEKEQLI